jgi:hypothetical protein
LYQFGKDSKPGAVDVWTAMGADNVMDPAGLLAVSADRGVVDTSADCSWHGPVPAPARWLARRRVPFADTYGLHTGMVVESQ